MNRAIKSICGEITLEGEGIVNYDAEQAREDYKRIYLRGNKFSEQNLHTNFQVAKSSYFREEDELGNVKIHRRVKDSANCIKHALMASSSPDQSSHFKKELSLEDCAAYLAEPTMLWKGWLEYLPNLTLKRKSPLLLTDFHQVDGPMPRLEVGSSAGPRSSNSYFHKETIGQVTMVGRYAIDVSELGFISVDPVFDRVAITEDMWLIFREYFQTFIGENCSTEISHYSKKTSYSRMSERGVLLPESVIKKLICEIFQHFLSLSIQKSSGYRTLQSMTVNFVREGDFGIHPGRNPADLTLTPNQESLRKFEKFLRKESLFSNYGEASPESIDFTTTNRLTDIVTHKSKDKGKKKSTKKKVSKKVTKAIKTTKKKTGTRG